MRKRLILGTTLMIGLVITALVVTHNLQTTQSQLVSKCTQSGPQKNAARIKACKQLLLRTKDPEEKATYTMQLCAAYSKERNWAKALQSCTASNTFKESAANYANLGAVQYALGDMVAALKSLDKASELNPKLIEPYCNRGYVLQSQGDPTKAGVEFNKANEIAKESKEPDAKPE